MLRPILPRIGRSLGRRTYLSVPPLAFKPSEGIPGLLSNVGYDVAWTQYQSLVIDKINAMTVGTPEENLQLKHLIIKTARSPSEASIFNYASAAHNNKFFFDCIRTTEDPVEMPSTLETELCNSFSSIDTLKREFIATANSMFGPGFVWLVKHETKYSILTTYNAGSPYPAAYYRRQSKDMNTESSASSPADYARNKALHDSEPTNSVGAFGPKSTSGNIAYGGVNLIPVLCVNTWEHVWVGDWGIAGKKQFLESWWDKINWEVVNEFAHPVPTKLVT